ncbi:hypothetical protein CKO32_16830 [Afifella marina DSM 2698]|nr:hypothetical protein [Afifella marina DSM 2698]MBK1628943.1 hypothetical protein [Afifella marina]MBK5918322.1 hypothetical protein [Afifella marina]RAI22840.1 hypothetical protein CH311_04090 [Afifella marina DSM 2698]
MIPSAACRHQDEVIAMPEPELAIDPGAPAHHLRSTRECARWRMQTTARLIIDRHTRRAEAREIEADFFETSERANAC